MAVAAREAKRAASHSEIAGALPEEITQYLQRLARLAEPLGWSQQSSYYRFGIWLRAFVDQINGDQTKLEDGWDGHAASKRLREIFSAPLSIVDLIPVPFRGAVLIGLIGARPKRFWTS